MADVLAPVPFEADMYQHVCDFRYGDSDAAQELSVFMKRDSLHYLAIGTRIWFYRDGAGEFVGFGSVMTQDYSYPTCEAPARPVAYIPALAVRVEHQGHRYMAQIVPHLVAEAGRLPGDLPGIVLHTHPDNTKVARDYEKYYGFTFLPGVPYYDPLNETTHAEYPAMARKIVRDELRIS